MSALVYHPYSKASVVAYVVVAVVVVLIVAFLCFIGYCDYLHEICLDKPETFLYVVSDDELRGKS